MLYANKGNGGNNPTSPAKLPREYELRKLALNNIKNGKELFVKSTDYSNREKAYNLYVNGIEIQTKLLKVERDKNYDNNDLISKLTNTIKDCMNKAKNMQQILAKMKLEGKTHGDIGPPNEFDTELDNLLIPEKFINVKGSNWLYPEDASQTQNESQGDVPKEIMSPEDQMLELINNVRQNSKMFIPTLETKMSYFQNNVIYDPTKPQGVATTEGPHAWQEAIRYLQNLKPYKKIVISSGLSLAAKDHAQDLANTGMIGHIGSDNSNLEIRLGRYGNWMGDITELIYAGEQDPKEVLAFLLVDDGQPFRRHRGLLLSNEFNNIGIAQAPSRFCTTVTVITLAKLFTNFCDMKSKARY